MAGHRAHPGVALASVPVGKAAIGILPGVELGDEGGDIGPGGGGVLFREKGQERNQREAAGAQLLPALVGVILHIEVPGAGIRGREACELQKAAAYLPAFAGLEGETGYRRNLGLGIPNGEGDGLRSLVAAAGGFYGNVGHAFFTGSLQAEGDQPVSLGGEGKFLRRGSFQLHRAVHLHGNGGFLHAVFHRKHVHRQLALLSRSQHARQGGHHHQGVLHGHRLVGTAEGAFVPGHHHHADAAHVGRKLELEHVSVLIGRPGLQEQHHGVEAVVLAGRYHILLVSTDGSQGREFAAEGTHHLVVQVPGLDAEGFAAVHMVPGIGRLEGRQVQKAFIHEGEGVSHRPAGLFGHLHGELLVRMQHLREGYHGLQMRGGVLHLHALDAVHPKRKVVLRGAVRLQQGYVYIDIGSHIGLYGKLEGGVLLGKGYPFSPEDAAGILQRNQGLTALGGRDVHRSFLTHPVGGLVGRDGEHREGFRVLPVGAAPVFGPVYGYEGSAHVAGGKVPGQDEVVAPVRIIHAEVETGIFPGGGEGSGSDFGDGCAVHVGVQFSSGIVPPPVPAGLEDSVFNLVAGYSLAPGIHHRQLHGLVLVRLQIVSFRYLDTYIGAVGGVGKGFGGEALVSSGLLHAGDHEGLQQARGAIGRRELDGSGGIAAAIQAGLEQRGFGRGETGSRVVESIFLKALEGGTGFAEGHFGPYVAVCGHPSGEPAGGYADGAGFIGLQHIRVGRGYLEAVGLDGLHVQGFVEGAAAHLEVRVPVAGGVIGLGGNLVIEEAVHTPGYLPGVELAFGGVHFQGGRVAFGQVLALVLEDEREVHRVSRAPDAAFSVHEALDALLNGFSAHIEAAEGAFVAGGDFQVGGAAAGPGHHGEGLSGHAKLRQAFSVRFPGSEFLELVIVHFYAYSGDTLCGDKVCGRHPEGAAIGILGHQAQVAG